MDIPLINFPEAIRKRLSLVVLLAAVLTTVAVGYYARYQTARMAEDAEQLTFRQDIMFATQDSSYYPLAAVNHDGRVVIWNQAMVKLTGYTEADIAVLGLGVLMPNAELATKHVSKMRAALNSDAPPGQVVIVRDKLRRADGTLIPVQVSVYVYVSRTGEKFAIARLAAQSVVKEIVAGEASTPNDKKQQ